MAKGKSGAQAPDASLEALATINKFLGDKELRVEYLRDVIDFPYWIDSGNIALNLINTGEYDKCSPGTKLIDLAGLTGAGKSLLAGVFARSILQQGGIVYIIDTENAWNKVFAYKVVGSKELADKIQINKTIDTIEGLEKFLNRILDVSINQKWKIPILIIVDSISNLSTIHEMELIKQEKNDKKDMFKAGLIKRMFRVLTRKMIHGNLTVVTTNHLIANIGVMYGPSHVTGGGSGVPYLADQRLHMLSPKKIEDSTSQHPLGIRIHAKVTKNRVVGEGRNCYTNLLFEGGIDKYSGLFELLYNYNCIELFQGAKKVVTEKQGGLDEIKKDYRCHFNVDSKWYEKAQKDYPQYLAKKFKRAKKNEDEDLAAAFSKDKKKKVEKEKIDENDKGELIANQLMFDIVSLKEFLKIVGEEKVVKHWQDTYNEVIKKTEQPADFIFADSTGAEDNDDDIKFADSILAQVETK
jgi:RecA/RadA recombinase